MMVKKKIAKVTLTARLEQPTLDQIKEIAIKEKRSVNYLINRMLRESLGLVDEEEG